MSETDRIVFSVLSNAERIDHVALAAMVSDTPRIEELPRIEEVPEPPRSPEAPRSPRPDPAPPAPEVAAPPEPAPYQPPPAPVFEPPPFETPPAPEAPPAPAPEPPPLPEDEDTKRTLLLDLQRLQLQGVQLTKEWTMEDRMEDMMLEMRRHTLSMDERANVNMMRDGMRLLVTGIEMVNNRIGLLDLEGWSGDVCRDLHKHDPTLSRIYRKYWKRSTSTSPEVDICLSLVGSMGLHHMKRTMSKQLVSGASKGFSEGFARRRTRAPSPPSSDEEGPPR